jgi:hypothetical protein
MDAEPILPTLQYTGSHSAIPDEKEPTFSEKLTSPEHAALETKDKPHTFPPSLNKLSKDKGSHDSIVVTAKAAEKYAPAPFLSLFRLDHPTSLMDIGYSPTQVFNSL